MQFIHHQLIISVSQILYSPTCSHDIIFLHGLINISRYNGIVTLKLYTH
jgi:hypothetical protein